MDIKIIARFLADECTSEEKGRVEQWVEADPENKKLMDELTRIWEASSDRKEALDNLFNAEVDWSLLQERIDYEEQFSEGKVFGKSSQGPFPKSHSGSRLAQFMKVAAVIIIMTLVGVIAYQNIYTPKQEVVEPVLREIAMEKGQRGNLTLSDGTKVYLNAESKIKLPDVFQENKRRVYLEGEAYFEVAPNANKPFIIHSKGALIRILGTSFSIRSYPEDSSVRVVVKEGRVSLKSKEDKTIKPVILTARELGRLNLSNENITTEKIEDLDLFLSWIDGYLKFKDTPLDEVARQLERKYDIKVNFDSPQMKSLRLTAVLKSRSIKNVLDVISTSLGIHYKLDQQTVVFVSQ